MTYCASIFAVITLVLSIGTGALAGEYGSSEKAKVQKPSVLKEGMVKAKATVQAIDLKNRIVTLKGEEGNIFDIIVGEQARNLPQVKVGDVVEVAYYESVAVKVYRPGEVPSITEDSKTLTRAKSGEKPGGLATRQATITATVESIDKKNQTAVLKGPDGKSVKVKVADPKNLENVNTGDEVVITYTQALAISVEKPMDECRGKCKE